MERQPACPKRSDASAASLCPRALGGNVRRGDGSRSNPSDNGITGRSRPANGRPGRVPSSAGSLTRAGWWGRGRLRRRGGVGYAKRALEVAAAGVHNVVTYSKNATEPRGTALRYGKQGGGCKIGVSAMQAGLSFPGLRRTEEDLSDPPISPGQPRGPNDARASGRLTSTHRSTRKTSAAKFVHKAYSKTRGSSLIRSTKAVRLAPCCAK